MTSSNKQLPPTRQHGLKPEDKSLNYDPLNLVKIHANPLAMEAQKLLEVTTKQKQAKKEDYSKYDESAWESNLDQWKSKRKSTVRSNSEFSEESPEFGVVLSKSPNLIDEKSFVTQVKIGSGNDEIRHQQTQQLPENEFISTKYSNEEPKNSSTTKLKETFKPKYYEDEFEAQSNTKKISTANTFSINTFDCNNKSDAESKRITEKPDEKISKTTSAARRPFSNYDHFSKIKREPDLMTKSEIFDVKEKVTSSPEKASISKFRNIKSFFENASSTQVQPQVIPRRKITENQNVEMLRKKSDSSNYSKNRMSLGPGVLESMSYKEKKIAIANDKEYLIEEHVMEAPKEKKEYQFTQDVSSKYKSHSSITEKSDEKQKKNDDNDETKSILRKKSANVEVFDLTKGDKDKGIERISMDIFENMIISPDKKDDKPLLRSSKLVELSEKYEDFSEPNLTADVLISKAKSVKNSSANIEHESDEPVNKSLNTRLAEINIIEKPNSKSNLSGVQWTANVKSRDTSGTHSLNFSSDTNKSADVFVVNDGIDLSKELTSNSKIKEDFILPSKSIKNNSTRENFNEIQKTNFSENTKKLSEARKQFFSNNNEDESMEVVHTKDINKNFQGSLDNSLKNFNIDKTRANENVKIDAKNLDIKMKKEYYDGEEKLTSLPINEDNVQYLSHLKSNESFEKDLSLGNFSRQENQFERAAPQNDPKTYVNEVFQMLNSMMPDELKGFDTPISKSNDTISEFKGSKKDEDVKCTFNKPDELKSKISINCEETNKPVVTVYEKNKDLKSNSQTINNTNENIAQEDASDEAADDVMPRKSFKDKQNLIGSLKLNERPSKPTPAKTTPPQVLPKPAARTSLQENNQKKIEKIGINIATLPKVLPTPDGTPLRPRTKSLENQLEEEGIDWDKNSKVQKLDVSASRSKSELSKHIRRRPPSIFSIKEGLSFCEIDFGTPTNVNDAKWSRGDFDQKMCSGLNQDKKENSLELNVDKNNNEMADVEMTEGDEMEVEESPPQLPSRPPPPSSEDDAKIQFSVDINKSLVTGNQAHPILKDNESDEENDDCLESSV
ncbi:hypothetical protein HELRODRAFT_190719 [Helobdella robusta]|uniref:DUF4757 domain-containing protein n=1 Tax=Helobdella robusta TaxID=6412 RepID=T1FS85_HELRO|nr:hypothetical protein HELRODRAFT_190719 [Helobdella robusta]ESO09123.1 hypothetical protein HELRODRAFT_190719 [Helobdella robusta]